MYLRLQRDSWLQCLSSLVCWISNRPDSAERTKTLQMKDLCKRRRHPTLWSGTPFTQHHMLRRHSVWAVSLLSRLNWLLDIQWPMCCCGTLIRRARDQKHCKDSRNKVSRCWSDLQHHSHLDWRKPCWLRWALVYRIFQLSDDACIPVVALDCFLSKPIGFAILCLKVSAHDFCVDLSMDSRDAYPNHRYPSNERTRTELDVEIL